VTSSIPKMDASALLLDIEGTTTPIDFVYQVLFPYARARVKDFLANRLSNEAVRQVVAALHEENRLDIGRGLDAPRLSDRPDQSEMESVVAYVHWLMGQDRKSTPLKSLQGIIWEEGYQRGELRSMIFADVPRAFDDWRRNNKDICVYSSGSRLAQELLFRHTEAGDLTGFIRDYFDTNVGAKAEAESYHKIARALGLRAAEIVFVSDVTAELRAAREAGLQTLLSVRPGNPPQMDQEQFGVIHALDEIRF
jgi:enolase-phosphatase E1